MTTPDRPIARLGFGTANLAGRLGRKESLRLLDVAWEAGIRHFDTAPMYGYGAAEGVLGDFVRAKIDRATVATKFGIEPPKKSALMSAAKAAARIVVSVVPSVRSKLASRAAAMVSTGNFDVPYAQMSLERSLAALGTPNIDMLLMHEPESKQIAPELVAFLSDAVRAGTIGAYGVASTTAETPRILNSGAAFGTVVQTPDVALTQAQSLAPGGTTFISHSIFSDRLKSFTAALAADASRAARCSEELGIDCADAKHLGRLFLWNAMLRNPGGVVIFSSLNDASIKQNAALQREPEFTAAQSAALDRLLAEST